jgi:hypothetical protein
MGKITLLLALVSAAPLGIAEKIRVDFDHGCNFSRYKTYRLAEPQTTEWPEGLFPNQLMQGRIVAFVEEALAAKQLTHVQTGGDLLVRYEMNVSEEPQYTTWTDGAGWDSSYSITTTQTIWMGTLVVSLTDSSHNQLVFQGSSTDTISSRPEKNTRRLQTGVRKIFEKYPPR